MGRWPAQALAEWAGFERVNGPILVHERIDVAAALICATLANLLTDRKRSYRPKDFLIEWDRGSRVQTPEEQMRLFRALTDTTKEHDGPHR